MSTISEHALPRGRSFSWLLFAVLVVIGLMAGLVQVPTAHAQEESLDSVETASLPEAVETVETAETAETAEAVKQPEVVAGPEGENAEAAVEETFEIHNAEGTEKGALFITEATLNRLNTKDPKVPFTAGEGLEFKFKWDASKYYGTPQAARAGDTLTVTLPEWAQFAAGTAEMKKDGVSVGTCVQTPRVGSNGAVTQPSRVVCTLNEYVNGRSEVSGGFESSIWMIKDSVITPTTFEVGPANVTVDISKLVDRETLERGVIQGTTTIKKQPIPENYQQNKTGIFHGLLTYSQGKAVMNWLILAKGNGGKITVRDAMTPPMEMATYAESVDARQGAVEVRVRDTVAEGAEGGHWNLIKDKPAGTADVLTRDQFSVAWTKELVDGQNRNVATVEIPQTEVGKWYRVSIFTQVDPDYYRAGDRIQNTATINGEEKTYTLTARNTINAYGEGRLGLGDVYIFKNIHGVDPAAIPENHSVRVKAEITYPDSRTETKILEVKPGQEVEKAGKLQGLPYLTKVKLTEENPGEIPGFKIESTTLGEGKSGVNVPQDDVQITPDKSSVTLTVRNANVTEIGINNSYVPAIKYGTFNIKKVVTKPEPPAAYGKRYDLTYTCDNDSKDGAYKANTLTTMQLADHETRTIGEFPVGTKCIVDENDANIPGFTWTKSPAQTIVIAEGDGTTVNLGTITNGYNEQLGSLKIRKNVNIEPAQAADKNDFKFTVRCERSTPAFAQDYEVSMKAGGEAELTGIPAGANCTITEDSESAKIPGYTWTLDQEKVVASIEDGAQAEVVVTNNYTKDVGKLVVTKTIKASATAGVTDKTFAFTYRCENTELGEVKEGELSDVAAGATVAVEGIAAGSNCEVKEKDANVPLSTWQVEGGATKTVKINANEDGLAQFDNVYTELMGQVKLNKKLAGSAAELAKLQDHKFEANYTCVKNGAEISGTVSFSVNEPAIIKDVPLGAVCNFTEKTGGLTEIEGVVFDQAKSTIEAKNVALPTTDADKDKVTEAELVNHFDELGRINLKKNVKGVAAKIVTDAQFPVTASWKLEGQDTTSVNFIIKDGEVYNQLPALPVGTVVTFKETLPANSPVTTWEDPKYSGKGVTDLDDAIGEATIQPGTFESAVEVELNNKVTPPLWWIPLLFIPFIPKPEVPTYQAPAESAPSNDQPQIKGIAKSESQKPAQENKSSLANTGASVLWVALAGLIIAAIGALLFIRARRNS